MPGQRRDLTAKQQAFLTEYLANGRNGAAAYRTVYAPKATTQRASEEAARLLRHPKIAPVVARAAEARSEGIRQALTRYKIDQAGVIARLALMADADVSDVLVVKDGRVVVRDTTDISPEASYAVTEIRQTESGLAVKMADKRAALMDIAKLNGWVVDRGQQLGADGKPIDPRQTFVLTIER